MGVLQKLLPEFFFIAAPADGQHHSVSAIHITSPKMERSNESANGSMHCGQNLRETDTDEPPQSDFIGLAINAESSWIAGVYNETAFVGLDYVLDTASSYGVRVLFTMSDYWLSVDSFRNVRSLPPVFVSTSCRPRLVGSH